MKVPIAIILAVLAFAAGSAAQTPVSLLDGKLTFVLPDNFKQKPPKESALAAYGATDGDEWMLVSLAKQPLAEGGLEAWMARKKASYTKGMPQELKPYLRWHNQEILTRDGVKWADLRFDCGLKGKPGILYTRFFATTVDGHLLEILLCGNQTSDAKRKAALDRIADSVKLKE